MVTRLSRLPDPSADVEFQGLLMDISQGGLRLTSRVLMHPNEKVRTIVTNDKTGLELNCIGVVRWSQKVTGGYVSGLQFTAVEKFTVPNAVRQAAERSGPSKPPGTQPSPAEPPASKGQSSVPPSSPA
jgi:hypothetical protein